MHFLDSLAVVPGLFPGWPPVGLPPVHVGQPQPPAAGAAPTPVAPATAAPPTTPSAAGNGQQDANQAQVVKIHVLLLQKLSLLIHFISLLLDVTIFK